ncbi:MAG: GyrI-like domain-containing protein [Corynebacteriales bacterium]|nr:GyrI-like domain-containing protein [Mycobacteriales bacterium]
MITIGDLASLARVSVRMLRHYDAIGLLTPAHVDPHSSYRYYDLDQLRRLNRIVALKDLGFTLEAVGRIVDDELTGDDLRTLLRRRQAEIAASIAAEEHRLARVAARIRIIESENAMTTAHITTTTVTPVRHVGLTAVAESATSEAVGPVIQPMYPQIIEALTAAGATPTGPSVAYYRPEPTAGEEAVRVHATFPVGDVDIAGLATIDLPGGEYASIIHTGSMDTVDSAYQQLNRWVTDQGLHLTGEGREIYLEMSDDPADWVTEVQVAFTR